MLCRSGLDNCEQSVVVRILCAGVNVQLSNKGHAYAAILHAAAGTRALS